MLRYLNARLSATLCFFPSPHRSTPLIHPQSRSTQTDQKRQTHILVFHPSLIRQASSRLRYLFNIISLDDDLILLVRERDFDTFQHGAFTDVFLAQEVSDLEGCTVVGWDGVDGEMGVDETHLVQEALDFSMMVD